jgi:hypothetical protein
MVNGEWLITCKYLKTWTVGNAHPTTPNYLYYYRYRLSFFFTIHHPPI